MCDKITSNFRVENFTKGYRITKNELTDVIQSSNTVFSNAVQKICRDAVEMGIMKRAGIGAKMKN